MRCRKCPNRAVLGIPRHHTAFCKTCLTEFVCDQVERAIKEEQMFTRTDRVLVAVSGGKDSLSLLDILRRLGYEGDAFYVDLGIGEYSRQSKAKVEGYTRPRGIALRTHELKEDEGAGINDLADLVRRPTCSVCGTLKRYHFNRTAVELGYNVLATGHNLDDEASRLLGNVLHWQTEYLDKQGPTLPASLEGFAKKVKPLYRLAEREIAAYAIVNKIDYIVEECPNSKGAKMLLYKDILNRLEAESPGTKQTFYWGFLAKQKAEEGARPSMTENDRAVLHPCVTCGQPTTADTCSYCKLMARAKQTGPATIRP
ncbi:MAG TPA: ATP-binding protein [Nitrospirales bacterium]|nr:ATP-binding protein [Nitrospirales bacterium]